MKLLVWLAVDGDEIDGCSQVTELESKGRGKTLTFSLESIRFATGDQLQVVLEPWDEASIVQGATR